MAADKGIDIVTTGQAVVYYETASNNSVGDKDLFDQSNSSANVGVQLNLDADLKNDFSFGSQVTYLGTAGLEKNLVSGVKQTTNGTTILNQAGFDDTFAVTKFFIAKKIANTTLKLGRQALPKSLSPLAFSETWNVFQNTFDAILAVNSDIPDTTVVAAYVGKGNGNTTGLAAFGDLHAETGGAVVAAGTNLTVAGTAYMLTVQNASLPLTTVTASYYNLAKVGDTSPSTAIGINADALWLDVAVAGKDLPLGLKVGLQAGQIAPESTYTTVDVANTTAFGANVSVVPADALTLGLAYSNVDGDDNKVNVAIKNTGTGIKTPLYTQMVYNQDAIAVDASTVVAQASYNTGDFGTVGLAYGMTSAGKSNIMGSEKDYNELDLTYKVNLGGADLFAAYINRTIDDGGAMNAAAGATTDDRIRVWVRYNF
jgi:hypothetical protein